MSSTGLPTTRRIVFRRLGDRVSKWMTINEPWVVADAGYLHGVHAPGHRNLFEAPIAAHHLLLAHGTAVTAFRSEAKGEIGMAINLEPKTPATDSPEDVAAAARADAYMNRQYMDAAFSWALSGGDGRDLRRRVAALRGRRLRTDCRTLRLPRRELLHPRAHVARRRLPAGVRAPRGTHPRARSWRRDGRCIPSP